MHGGSGGGRASISWALSAAAEKSFNYYYVLCMAPQMGDYARECVLFRRRTGRWRDWNPEAGEPDSHTLSGLQCQEFACPRPENTTWIIEYYFYTTKLLYCSWITLGWMEKGDAKHA